MPTPKTLARLDTLIWTLIFGGLLLVVLGLASHDEARIAGWSLLVLGGIGAITGAVLVVVRARLPETPEPGAQSKP